LGGKLKMEEILFKIENSISPETKNKLKKHLIINMDTSMDFSNNLKSMVQNYSDLKEILFKNNESAIHFSGDILAKTLRDYWIKGGNIMEIFIENAQATSFYANFECVW
jgi:hypothetical protein